MTIKIFKRTITFCALATITMLSFTPSSYAMGLKENSLITDNTIKLGDIFYGLSRDEDRVLGNAPRPGEDMVLSARTLQRIAIALDLPWRPSSNADQVTLRRDATIIEYDQIKEELYTALYDEGVYGDFELSIPARHQRIILPANEPAKLSVTGINVDSKRSTFEVTLAAPSAENPIQQLRIKGQMHHVIHVPVLVENIEHGRKIRDSDIETITIRERDFSKDTIVDAQKLVGMTARRMLIAGRPIKEVEVIAPQIIERGQLVMLNLNNGIMNISTQVKALENGAKGDIIRVVNASSNQTLQAIVTGDNRVSVVNN